MIGGPRGGVCTPTSRASTIAAGGPTAIYRADRGPRPAKGGNPMDTIDWKRGEPGRRVPS